MEKEICYDDPDSKARTEEINSKVENLVLLDRRIKTFAIAEEVGILKTSVLTIVHADLGMSKAFARWQSSSCSIRNKTCADDSCSECCSIFYCEGIRLSF